MPKRIVNRLIRPAGNATVRKRSFRQRYDNLEQMRIELIERLDRYGERGRAHPAFKRAVVLLNETFRKSSIAQRAAVLQAASWVIELIENSLGSI